MDSYHHFQKLAERTENKNYKVIAERSAEELILRLDHAAYGFITETGEFTDVLKKYKIYGKPLDIVNLREELSDLLWYVALACNALNIPIEEIMDLNINKLKDRYPEKYTDYKAINRNLETERKTLEYNYEKSQE
jgi:NTP pyrophosphatase (non-canonical NTP hydrolase)